MLKLNLGAGKSRIPGTIAVDIFDYGDNVVWDLASPDPLPFADNSCDEFLMHHVLEHIPNPLRFMERLHRIAAPGAKLHIAAPFAFSEAALEDPTHINQFTFRSFVYYSQPAYCHADYGYRGDWDHDRVIVRTNADLSNLPYETLYQMCLTQRNVAIEIKATLTAIKPIRPAIPELLKVPRVVFT